jgi:hypothetical protein
MTNKEMLEIIMNEFKDYKEDWKDYKEKQEKVNELVIRHDEKIDGFDKDVEDCNKRIDKAWRIPTLIGSIIVIISGIGTFVSFF